MAEKRTEQVDAPSNAAAATAHLDLPPLSGSERQIAWASTIRAQRLAAMIAIQMPGGARDHEPCLAITDAKWWIDYRDLNDAALFARAATVAARREAAAPMMIVVQSVGIA